MEDYDTEFTHVINEHTDDVIRTLREGYSDDLFSLTESFLREEISERELVDRVKFYLTCAAERVYDKHDYLDEGV